MEGTKRQFSLFVDILNRFAEPFGIRFGSWDIGKSVDFLDVTLYLDNSNKIQYKLYTKPTDARNYLRTDSFHPPHVFRSVAFSQMLRVANRNSRDDTRLADLEVLKSDLKRSGHNPVILDNLEPTALSRTVQSSSVSITGVVSDIPSSIVFPVDYFVELPELKRVVDELKGDICSLLGPTRIIMAPRKGRAIANKVLRNGAICDAPRTTGGGGWSQKCGASRCLTCAVMGDGGDVYNINEQLLKVPMNHNCKSSNIIYSAQCTICDTAVANVENTYFGQTIQKLHQRVNGHRSKFNANDYETSALSVHAHEHHPDNFSINNFKFAVVKSCNPMRLNREEFKCIEKFRTNCLGINRCKVER